MTAGVMAAASAALPLKVALASDGPKARRTALIRQPIVPTAPTPPSTSSLEQLNYYTKATFLPYVNSKFRVHVGPSNVRGVTLKEVSDYLNATEQGAASTGTECFSLLFTLPPGKPFEQETYLLEHEALGKFYMFLVPVSARRAQQPDFYEAVIYRRHQSVTNYHPTYFTDIQRTAPGTQPTINDGPATMPQTWPRNPVSQMESRVTPAPIIRRVSKAELRQFDF
jgi:hypothetical protein